MKTTFKFDKTICSGCLCLKLAKGSSSSLHEFCHGTSLIKPPGAEKYFQCPCSECIVKGMCTDACEKFAIFRKLKARQISTEEYIEMTERGTNGSH